MSNQEQQFYSPEQLPSPSQQSYQYYQPSSNVNVGPREQQQQEMYGEHEYYTGRGEKLQPYPPRRKRFRAFWLVPIVVLFLIGGMSFGLFAPHEQFGKGFGGPDYKQFDKGFGGFEHEQGFKVGATPKLIILDTTGSVHIHSSGDSSNAHVVTIRMDGNGQYDLNSIATFDEGSDTITIDTEQQGFNNANIDITTPGTSDVNITDDSGDVNIEGVAGNVNVQTKQGRIDANTVSGQVVLSSVNGDVSVENGSMSGQSSLHSDNGNIRYSGSIAPEGSYKFDTLSGSIDVALPSNTAFHLDANSANGQIENGFGSNDVGSGTRPQLTVNSTNGSIQISKND